MTLSREARGDRVAYRTDLGSMVWGTTEDWLDSSLADDMAGSVQALITSPPFPLNRKKAYGNLSGDEYKRWLTALVGRLKRLLRPDGSLVIELGNAWVAGSPEMSTLPLETLLELKHEHGLHLCQQFIVHNPARLPSPAQWVNIERIRVKDSFTTVWWLATTPRPKANNKRVLTPYSARMQKLLERGSYNAGSRPSGFDIGETSFLKDNGGAIPPNVITVSNTSTHTAYASACKRLNVRLHPARMQPEVAGFFIAMLSEPGDLILDCFAGSNTTGEASENLGRRWASIESELDYIRGSTGRFPNYEWVLPQEVCRPVAKSPR